VRSYSTLYFVEAGWSKQKKLVEPLVDALSATGLWQHLPLLSTAGSTAKSRGSDTTVKTAFMSGKNEYSLLCGGDTTFDESTTAYVTIQYGSAGVQISTCVRDESVETLGKIALDDFFTMLSGLHDRLKPHAHVVRATAWTEWNDNTPDSELTCAWPLRAIADVVEPGRPKKDDRFWEAAQTIATAKPPARVSRSTHGGLVMLRWIDDPMDAAAADAAAVKHEAWIKTLLDTAPE
jgi:hypothetical protein